jgi:hypothetical protein
VIVAIEIPDDIGRLLAGQVGDVSRAVLEAVAVKAYRSGGITSAQVGGMSPQFATHPGKDNSLGHTSICYLVRDGRSGAKAQESWMSIAARLKAMP